MVVHMKKGAILLFLIILLVPFSSAETIKILDIFNRDPGNERLPTFDEGAQVFFYAGERLIASRIKNVQSHYLNRLGSNVNGRQLPFGQELIDSGERFEFTGKELEESGLNYFGARYYDSSIGRFTSIDPIKENHAYIYVLNNPLNFVDPDGKAPYQYGTEDILKILEIVKDSEMSGGVPLIWEEYLAKNPETKLDGDIYENLIGSLIEIRERVSHYQESDYDLDSESEEVTEIMEILLDPTYSGRSEEGIHTTLHSGLESYYSDLSEEELRDLLTGLWFSEDSFHVDIYLNKEGKIRYLNPGNKDEKIDVLLVVPVETDEGSIDLEFIFSNQLILNSDG